MMRLLAYLLAWILTAAALVLGGMAFIEWQTGRLRDVVAFGALAAWFTWNAIVCHAYLLDDLERLDHDDTL